MKTILFTLTLFLSSSSFAQFTLISGANFESALIFQGLDTLPLNGQILTASIDTLTFLEISGENIIDLTGIEDFSALETLDCGSNVLTYLDLSQNSNLTQLFTLYNPLTCLNVKNGNNMNFTLFSSFECPDLECIQVDDASFIPL